MSDSSRDRQGNPRVEARIKLRFATPEALAKEYNSNLSKGGLFITSKKSRPLRSQVKFLLILPVTDESVELTGEVVHVVEAQPGTEPATTGLGIQFTDLDAAKRSKIESYISRIDENGEFCEGDECVEDVGDSNAFDQPDYLQDALRRASKDLGDLSPHELVEVKRKLKRFYTKKSGRNHYDLLGVGYGATPGSIRTAYHKLSMEFYPDRQPKGLPMDLKEGIEDVFGRINRAYKVLKDIDRRLEYDISVGNWRSVEGIPELSEDAKRAYHLQSQYNKQFPDKVERAESLLAEAQTCMASGDEVGAKTLVKFAYSFNPYNPNILYLMDQLGLKAKPAATEAE